jgi:hypothetical protein
MPVEGAETGAQLAATTRRGGPPAYLSGVGAGGSGKGRW